jgi:hypothetical protein
MVNNIIHCQKRTLEKVPLGIAKIDFWQPNKR